MNTKFVLILFALLIASSMAFAAANVTINSPTENTVIYGGRTVTLDFNIVTEDGNAQLASVVPKLQIFYSTVAGSRSYLIYNDTNLSDGSNVQCADYNFFDTTDCNYTWSVPGAPDLMIGTYYLDFNLSYPNTTSYVRTNETFSSSAFQVQQPMSASMTSMIALALFILACAIAVVAVMGLGNGMDVRQFLMMVIAVIVALVVAWTLYASVIVV